MEEQEDVPSQATRMEQRELRSRIDALDEEEGSIGDVSFESIGGAVPYASTSSLNIDLDTSSESRSLDMNLTSSTDNLSSEFPQLKKVLSVKKRRPSLFKQDKSHKEQGSDEQKSSAKSRRHSIISKFKKKLTKDDIRLPEPTADSEDANNNESSTKQPRKRKLSILGRKQLKQDTPKGFGQEGLQEDKGPTETTQIPPTLTTSPHQALSIFKGTEGNKGELTHGRDQSVKQTEGTVYDLSKDSNASDQAMDLLSSGPELFTLVNIEKYKQHRGSIDSAAEKTDLSDGYLPGSSPSSDTELSLTVSPGSDLFPITDQHGIKFNTAGEVIMTTSTPTKLDEDGRKQDADDTVKDPRVSTDDIVEDTAAATDETKSINPQHEKSDKVPEPSIPTLETRGRSKWKKLRKRVQSLSESLSPPVSEPSSPASVLNDTDDLMNRPSFQDGEQKVLQEPANESNQAQSDQHGSSRMEIHGESSSTDISAEDENMAGVSKDGVPNQDILYAAAEKDISLTVKSTEVQDFSPTEEPKEKVSAENSSHSEAEDNSEPTSVKVTPLAVTTQSPKTTASPKLLHPKDVLDTSFKPGGRNSPKESKTGSTTFQGVDPEYKFTKGKIKHGSVRVGRSSSEFDFSPPPYHRQRSVSLADISLGQQRSSRSPDPDDRKESTKGGKFAVGRLLGRRRSSILNVSDRTLLKAEDPVKESSKQDSKGGKTKKRPRRLSLITKHSTKTVETLPDISETAEDHLNVEQDYINYVQTPPVMSSSKPLFPKARQMRRGSLAESVLSQQLDLFEKRTSSQDSEDSNVKVMEQQEKSTEPLEYENDTIEFILFKVYMQMAEGGLWDMENQDAGGQMNASSPKGLPEIMFNTSSHQESIFHILNRSSEVSPHGDLANVSPTSPGEDRPSNSVPSYSKEALPDNRTEKDLPMKGTRKTKDIQHLLTESRIRKDSRDSQDSDRNDDNDVSRMYDIYSNNLYHVYWSGNAPVDVRPRGWGWGIRQTILARGVGNRHEMNAQGAGN